MNTPPTPEEMREIFADPKKLNRFFADAPEEFWIKSGQKMALDTFKTAVEQTAAYPDFLAKSNVDPETITDLESFSKLPETMKENYFDKYSLQDTVVGGDLGNMYLISTSGGSTGKPHYWPRGKNQDAIAAAQVELMLSILGIEGKTTLFIVGIALGTWVAGTYMTDTTLTIGRKANTKLTVITPGANNPQILEIVQDIGHSYDQIIMVAYPPTARNVLLEGIEIGIDWKKYNMKFMVGGEPVSYAWKEYVLSLIGSERLDDILIIFGMSELGTLSFETPIANQIRKLIHQDHELCRQIFGVDSVAAFVQYPANARWVETDNGELVITATGGTPFVRYKTHDLGGIISYSDMLHKLEEAGYDIFAELERAGNKTEDVWKWPFVFSLGRGDCVSLMGANIFPRNFEDFMHRHQTVNNYKISVEHSSSQRPEFRIYLELREGLILDSTEIECLRAQARDDIQILLKTNNADYADALTEEPELMSPRIIIQEHNSGVFSDTRLKQQHILNSFN